jgi:Rib/alpha/Esp surface antigen-like repeat protein
VKSDTATVLVDSLAAIATLGADTTLCAGNKIGLQRGAKPGLVYQWSTSATTPIIYITQSGDYSVTVQSLSGCLFKDTVNVFVRGVAPVASFSADSVCFGNNTSFTNTSFAIAPAVLTDYFWEFGNGITSSSINPNYTYPQAGEYAVKLSVYSSDTCANDTVLNVRVFALPQVYFDVDTVCSGKPIVFYDKTVIENVQSGLSWNWNFGDATFSSLQNPVKSYANVGSYLVSLKVVTNKLCEDTFAKIVTAIPPQAAPESFTSYLPVDSASSANRHVDFKWNVSNNATYYKLQISTVNNFSTLLFDTVTYSSSMLLRIPGNLNAYWWRVVAYNRCGDSVVTKTKILFISSPNVTPNLKAWFRADSLVTVVSGAVSQWGDASGNGFNALQGTAANRPALVQNITSLNGKSAIRFDGTNDLLRVASFNQNQPMSAFIVWKANGTGIQFAFGGIDATNRLSLYYSGGSIAMLGGGGILYNKSAPFNYTLNSALFNRNTSSLYDASVAKATGDVGANVLTGLNIGTAHNTTNFLNGDIAEIILYDKNVTTAERQNVERYLRTKYAPPVSLGPDIKFAYGACDTTLRIKQHFAKVLWSTGDTGVFSIKVRKSGKYWVRATDVFGYVSSDTVNVSVPYSGISPAKDTIVCAGNSVELKFGINGAPYFFEWSTGDTGISKITVNQSGRYFVRVSDTIGCQLTSDTIRVAVDSLEFFSVLDNDTITCTNSPLALFPYVYPYKTYQWSTGGTKDTIMVPGAGKIYVTVTDVNGCSTKDSINIKVKGVAPVVDFAFKNRCFGDTTEFTDLTTFTAPEQLVNWVWNMGENDTLFDQNPKKVFPFVGTFNVALTAVTDSGCFAKRVKPVVIGSRPTPLISYNITCANASTLIADASTIIAGDTIKNWFWTLPNGNTYTSKNFSVKFDTVGSYPVKLVVTSAKGCVDSTMATVEVFPAINPDFVYNNQCQDKPTVFKDITNSLSIIKRVWKLTNTPGIINDSIQFSKTFYAPDSFEVILEVTNSIGCKDTARKQVIIYPTPIADFIDSAGCVGASVTMRENSVSVDSIAKFDWKFGNIISKSIAPTFALPDTGKIPVSLKVTTAKGCVDSVSKMFSVIPLPKANFTFSPIFGEAPLDVTMLNQSSKAVAYNWSFGNGETANDANPTVRYVTNDTFNIQLTAYNYLGCADSIEKKILVIPTDLDIALINIATQRVQLANGNFATTVIARYANVGTQPILNAQLLATLDKGTTIMDDWSGFLFPGEILTHTFSSSFYITKTTKTQYVCVDAVNVNGGGEKNTANNRNCRSLDNQTVVTNLYPNPAIGKINLDLIMPDAEDFTFEISNEMGQRLLIDATYRAVRGYNKVEFDVRNYLPGIYYLKATYSDNVIIQKFQVIR